MSILCSTNVYDALLDHIVQNTTLMSVCTTQPTASSQASSSGGNYARAFAQVSSSHWTKADSSVSGRKISSTAYSSLTVTSSGSCEHVALLGGSTLLFVTCCTPLAVTTTENVTIPSWAIHCLAPTSST